jgi:acetylornithine/succinyldiaminopimelate/putrescine aminotransferase
MPATANKTSLLEDAEKVFSRGLTARNKALGHDFVEAGGEGAFVVDSDGNRYLDCFTSAGTYNLGRRNAEIADELKRASHETDQGIFICISRWKAELAKRLTGFVSGYYAGILWSAVRGEAFDAACKVARGYTGRTELISVDGGWYGETGFAITLSSRDDKEQFGRLIPDTRIIPHGDIEAAEKAIGERTAAVVLEPVQAENHCRVADRQYLEAVRVSCRRNGALLIFDETQTGFGRTGYRFASQHMGVTPDILVFGEALSGGMFPTAGIVFTRAVKGFFEEHPLIHLHTFGGHDLGCRVSVKALDVYERDRPWENARAQGERLRGALDAVAEKHPKKVESVSGAGLLQSIRLKTPAKARKFCAAAASKGIFVVPGEVDRSCVPIRPVLTLSDEETETVAKTVAEVVAALK